MGPTGSRRRHRVAAVAAAKSSPDPITAPAPLHAGAPPAALSLLRPLFLDAFTKLYTKSHSDTRRSRVGRSAVSTSSHRPRCMLRLACNAEIGEFHPPSCENHTAHTPMSKRSREESFSPLAESESVASTEDEDHALRPAKISAQTTSDQAVHDLPVMQCSLPPHRQALDFNSIEAFELHYHKDHCNRCSSCDKNFPSAHFLSLHIDENHNSLRAEREAKGEKTYACLVEDCEKQCSTPQKRRLHLIDKHLFPKSYNFRVINSGIDKRTSMLTEPKPQRRRVSTTGTPADRVTRHRRASSQLLESSAEKGYDNSTSSETYPKTVVSRSPALPSTTMNDQVDDLTKTMSALQFVPSSVRRQNAKKATT